jgi:hypothetical protein
VKNGSFVSVIALAFVVVVFSLAAQPAVAQALASGPTSIGGCPADILAFHKCALEKAKAFDPPRTPGGKPDMQGYWRDRLAMVFSVEGVSETEPLTRDPIQPWIVDPGMVVDPPDRRIPYQPWAAEVGRKGQNFLEYIDPRTACATGGVPRAYVQGPIHLLQREDYVLWLLEDKHAHRIITMDGRHHVGESIKLWHGDSRGRWEGNTLVIDVTNVNGYTWLDDAGNFHTDAVHMVERLTMIDPDTIHYEITLEDPKAYTRPWTMAWPLVREKEPGFELLEEGCWEGERDVPKFLNLGLKYYFGETWRSR